MEKKDFSENSGEAAFAALRPRTLRGEVAIVTLLWLAAHLYYLLLHAISGPDIIPYALVFKPFALGYMIAAFLLTWRSVLFLAVMVPFINPIVGFAFFSDLYPYPLSNLMFRLIVEHAATALFLLLALRVETFRWWVVLILAGIVNQALSFFLISTEAILTSQDLQVSSLYLRALGLAVIIPPMMVLGMLVLLARGREIWEPR